MRTRTRGWRAVAAACAAGAAAAAVVAAGIAAVSAGEPPDPSDLPGPAAGRLEVRWLAPYVAEVVVGIGPKSGGRIVWYGEDGAVLRDLLGATSGPGFATVTAEDGGSVVHGTRADWRLTLPPPPRTAPGAPATPFEFHVAASEDGRTFVRQQTAPDGTTSADVFVDGAFAGRIGPFPQWRGETVRVGDDGSVALLAPAAPGNPGCRVVVAAPGGKLAFETACTEWDSIDALAPAGRGVLLRRSAPDTPDTWLFASPAGLRAAGLGAGAHVVAWLPGTSRAVVESGPDDAPRLLLVDCDTAKVVWDVEDQPLHGKRAWPGAAVEGDLVLLSGLEAQAVGKVSHWRRRVDALDAATGARVAVWRSMFPSPVGYSEAAAFRRRGDTLYLVAPDRFAPVRIADIRAKTNRWE